MRPALRKLTKAFRAQAETPEAREKRERLEFFCSHSPQEIARLSIWFHEIIESGEVGVLHTLEPAQPTEQPAIPKVWNFGSFNFSRQ